MYDCNVMLRSTLNKLDTLRLDYGQISNELRYLYFYYITGKNLCVAKLIKMYKKPFNV